MTGEPTHGRGSEEPQNASQAKAEHNGRKHELSDVVWDAIKQSDPAAHRDELSSLDLAALEAKVAAKIAVDQDTDQELSAVPSAVITQLSPVQERRPRRSRRWLAAVATVALATAAGGGGYLIGAHDDGESSSIASEVTTSDVEEFFSAPDVTQNSSSELDGATGDASAQSSAAGSDSAASTSVRTSSDSRAAAQSSQDKLMAAWESGRYRFSDGGLSTQRTSATGWGSDVASVANAKTLKRAAEVLEVDNDVTEHDWGWQIAADQGSTVSLSLSKGGYLNYYDESASSEETSGRLSNAKMSNRVLKLLDSMDIDTTGAKVVFEDYQGDDNYAWFSVELSLDGRTTTNAGWSVTFNGDQLVELSGSLAPFVSLGTYEVISPAEALTRLQDPLFSEVRWPTSYPTWLNEIWDGPNYYSQIENSWNATPPTPQQGAKLSLPMVDVSITKATLGLSSYTDLSGAEMILPTYQLSDDSGATWQVLAISDSYIDTSTQ